MLAAFNSYLPTTRGAELLESETVNLLNKHYIVNVVIDTLDTINNREGVKNIFKDSLTATGLELSRKFTVFFPFFGREI